MVSHRENGITLIQCGIDAVLFFRMAFSIDFLISWALEVQNIFYQGSKRKLVPSNQDKLEHFFNCAATMMTQHLQSLALDSIADFVDLLVQPPVNVCSCSHSVLH